MISTFGATKIFQITEGKTDRTDQEQETAKSTPNLQINTIYKTDPHQTPEIWLSTMRSGSTERK